MSFESEQGQEQELLQLNAEIAAHSHDFEPLVERGNLYAERGQFEKALADYSRALEIAPHEALIWDNRGVVRLYLLDYYPALADFSQALSLEPDYFYALANRAYVYALLNKPEWALEDARRALEIEPQHAPAYDVIGQAYTQLGNLEKAFEALSTAMQLDPGCVQAPFHRASVLRQLGRNDEARTDLLLYLSLNDDQQNSTYRRNQAQTWLTELG